MLFCSWIAQRALDLAREDDHAGHVPARSDDPVGPEGPHEPQRLHKGGYVHEGCPEHLFRALALDSQRIHADEFEAVLPGDPLFHAPLRSDEQDLGIRAPVPDAFSNGYGRHDVPPGASGSYDDLHTLAPRETESTIPDVTMTVMRLEPP